MIIIFDLDYALLDTIKFKKDLAKVYSMSSKKWLVFYLDFLKKYKNFNLEKFLEFIIKQEKLNQKDIEKIKIRFNDFEKNINNYLFPKSSELVKKLAQKKNKLFLVSYGDKEWQKLKIEKLKIKKYFSKIITTDKNKEQLFDFLKNNKNDIIIINDNARESIAMQKTLKNSQLFLIKGPYSENVKHNLKTYHIGELIQLIDNK